MRIPKKIFVNEVDVNIAEVPANVLSYKPGDYDSLRKEIRLAKELKEADKAEVLLHEIIEDIVDTNDIGINHAQISVLSTQIFSVIRRNSLDFLNKGNI